MNTQENQLLRRVHGRGFALAAVVAVIGLVGPAIAQAGERSLSDFLNAQGTTSFFWNPFPDYLGWANNPTLVSSSGKSLQCRFAGIDYAGLSAKYLKDHVGLDVGTTVSGSVHERPLADGRAEVSVSLHTTNAVTFAQTCDNLGPGNPSAFGEQQTDLLLSPSLEPGLSTVNFLVVFKNTAPGAPLPDLVCVTGATACPEGFELVSLYMRANGSGPLHYSSGFEEGTPGHLVVTQTGIFRPAAFTSPKSRISYDAFPAERVDWHR
jgi:hypothetical protein